jgi:hypothetical protein
MREAHSGISACYSAVTLVDDFNIPIGYGHIMYHNCELIGPILADLNGNPLEVFEWNNLVQDSVILVVYNETVQ